MKRAYDHYRSSHADFLRGDRATEETLFQLMPHLAGRESRRVLEIGCGGGELLGALSAVGFGDVAGVDSSKEQVDAAAKLGVPVAHQDARAFLVGTSTSYGVVLALDVLEHVEAEELVDLIEHIFHRLEPGGRMIARVPNLQAPFGGAIAYGDLTHRTHMAPTAALQLFRLAGFVDLAVHPCGPAPSGWKRLIRRQLWRAQQGIFRIMFSIESGLNTQTVFSMNFLIVGTKRV